MLVCIFLPFLHKCPDWHIMSVYFWNIIFEHWTCWRTSLFTWKSFAVFSYQTPFLTTILFCWWKSWASYVLILCVSGLSSLLDTKCRISLAIMMCCLLYLHRHDTFFPHILCVRVVPGANCLIFYQCLIPMSMLDSYVFNFIVWLLIVDVKLTLPSARGISQSSTTYSSR